MNITERQQKLLEQIIRQYVHTAEPVSSKALEESGSLDVSSATIRAEMTELERMGLLEKPHTSAGRVPSDKAYRFFVDRVVKAEPWEVGAKEKRKIDETIHDVPRDPHHINKSIAQVLSELSDNLVITNVREEDDFFKVGLKSLFELPEFREFDRMFRLTSFFEEFDSVFSSMVHRGSRPTEVQIFIGRESPFADAQEEAILFTEYRLPHRSTGSVTLIGPTRMDYERNIGLLKYIAQQVNRLTDE